MKNMFAFLLILSACNNNKTLSHEEIIDSLAKKLRDHIDSVVAKPPLADSLLQVLTLQILVEDSIHVSGKTKDDAYYFTHSRPILRQKIDSLRKLRLYPNAKL